MLFLNIAIYRQCGRVERTVWRDASTRKITVDEGAESSFYVNLCAHFYHRFCMSEKNFCFLALVQPFFFVPVRITHSNNSRIFRWECEKRMKWVEFELFPAYNGDISCADKFSPIQTFSRSSVLTPSTLFGRARRESRLHFKIARVNMTKDDFPFHNISLIYFFCSLSLLSFSSPVNQNVVVSLTTGSEVEVSGNLKSRSTELSHFIITVQLTKHCQQ